MKAIIYEKYGPASVLQVKEIEKPSPKPNEVLIKIYAVEATKSDCEMRSFNFQVQWFWLPLRIFAGLRKPRIKVLGGYFAGEIEATGNNVTKYKKGDQIFGATQMRFGAYGEYLCLPESYTFVSKPKNLSYIEASTIPLGGLNALHFMRKANIQKGDQVVVNGAGGSIGTFAVQIAKTFGAEVSAVDSSIKEEMLRDIGADHFIDYTKQDFTKNGKHYDVIFSVVANNIYSQCVAALKPGGRYIMANPHLLHMLRSSLTEKFSDKKIIFSFAEEKEEELLALKEMLEQKKIRPVVDKVYAFEDAKAAHLRVETEERLGSVVLSIEPNRSE